VWHGGRGVPAKGQALPRIGLLRCRACKADFTVENYFSILKRGIVGVYHHVSAVHLHRYAAEFDFRYNNRIGLGVDDQARTVTALKGIRGKRLLYRDSSVA
jgi:hypothetical protein